MEVLSGVSFLTEVIDKIVGWRSTRPRLRIKITTFRPDPPAARWIFRASVLNHSTIAATGCEGFWSLFDPALREVSSGNGVWWAPVADNDYDFKIRNSQSVTIQSNARRFCWADLDVTPVPVEKTDVRLFPFDGSQGLYTFALVIEYGRYKAFDSIGINVPRPIGASTPIDQIADKVQLQWKHRHRLREWSRHLRLRHFISQQDYHDYVRPT